MFKTKKYLSIVLILVLIFSNISYAGSYISEDEIYIDKPYKIFNFEMTDKIDRNTVDNTTATINGIDIRIAYKDDYTLSIIPLEKYSEGTTYEIKLMGNIQSMAGESLVPFSQKFIYIDDEDSNQPTNFENIIFEETEEYEDETPTDSSEDDDSDSEDTDNSETPRDIPEDTEDETIEEEDSENPEAEEEQIATYTVLFKDYTGGLLSEQEMEEGSSATEPVQPTREGYTFIGWDMEFSNITEDTIVSAQYEKDIVTHVVKFVDYNGDVLKEEIVNDGEDATPPENIIREGYTFIGWYSDFTNITEEKIVTAKYEDNIYTVTFLDYNGDILKEETINAGQDSTNPTPPEVEGHSFIEWDTDTSNIQNDLTVSPVYEKKIYTVTFLNFGDGVQEIIEVKSGEGVTPPLPENRVGYVFIEWDTDLSDINEDLTVRPIHELEEYIITFIGTEGEIIDAQTVSGDYTLNEPDNPEKVGYTFTGWSPEIGYFSEDTTITAQYEKNKYTVNYIDYNDNILFTEEVEYEGNPSPPEDPTRGGYIFTGWDSPTNVSVTGDMTFTAIYNEESSTTSGAVDIEEDSTTNGAVTTTFTKEELNDYQLAVVELIDSIDNYEEQVNFTRYFTQFDMTNIIELIPVTKTHYAIEIINDNYQWEKINDIWQLNHIEGFTYVITEEESIKARNIFKEYDDKLDLEKLTNREKAINAAYAVAERYSYDTDGSDEKQASITGQSKYAVLSTDNETVCSGYAYTYAEILKNMGIRSDFVKLDYIYSSGKREPHVYNKIYLSQEEIVYTDITHMDNDDPDNYKLEYLMNNDLYLNESDSRDIKEVKVNFLPGK